MDREQMIARYREGLDVVLAALDGISDEELDRVPAEGEWSPRSVVHHLADAETIAYVRLRRLLAEDDPVIHAYDQDRYSRVLHYDRPIEPSLELVRVLRTANADLLEQLDDLAWRRSGTHEESGPWGVERWLEIYVNHPRAHAQQIERARAGG